MTARRLRDPRALALADQILVSLGTFLLTLVAARALTTEDFSELSLTLLILLLMSNVHRAAVTQPAGVLVATENDTQAQDRLARTLALNGVCAAASAVVFVALGATLGISAIAVVLGWVAFATFSYQDTLRRHAYSRNDVSSALVLSIIVQVIVCACLGLAYALGQTSPASFLAALALSSAASAGWGAYRWKVRPTWHLSSSSGIWREHWPVASWLLLTVAAVWGASQIYMFLGAALGAMAVAYLATCRSILSALSVISQTLANTIPSQAAVCLKERGVAGVRQLLGWHVRLISSVSLVFLAIVIVAAEPVLRLLYGEPFAGAAPFLRILALGYVMSLAGSALGAFCVGLGDSRSGLYSNLVGMAFTVSAGLWLIVEHDLYGLVTALTISLALTAVTQWLFVRRILRSPDAAGSALPRRVA